MISVVVISKDEPALRDTLVDLADIVSRGASFGGGRRRLFGTPRLDSARVRARSGGLILIRRT